MNNNRFYLILLPYEIRSITNPPSLESTPSEARKRNARRCSNRPETQRPPDTLVRTNSFVLGGITGDSRCPYFFFFPPVCFMEVSHEREIFGWEEKLRQATSSCGSYGVFVPVRLFPEK